MPWPLDLLASATGIGAATRRAPVGGAEADETALERSAGDWSSASANATSGSGAAMFEGRIHPDFWPVARVLRSQIPKPGPGGAAVCIYHRGEVVVDIWAGTRDDQGTPWSPDTLSLSYSTTKGVASTLLHVLADRGLVEYDEPVAKYWPEFAQAGKERITVRQVLCHEAGLYHVRDMIDHARRMMDWDYMTWTLARTAPCHTPGAMHGYHGLTYGWLVGEIIQRVTGRNFSDVLREELAEPLGLDGLYCGLPADQSHRRARLIMQGIQAAGTSPDRLTGYLHSLSRLLRTMRIPVDLRQLTRALIPKGMHEVDFNALDFQQVPIPSANGMFNARSLARLYAMLAGGGEIDGVRILSARTVARAMEVQNRTLDRVVPAPMHWRLGYHRPFTMAGGIPTGIGHFGFGGSGAWADPTRQLAVAMVLNSGVGTPFGDLRIIRLSTAAVRCADRR
jgi:CubicO group peptidase (beta-lactamase class C family)